MDFPFMKCFQVKCCWSVILSGTFLQTSFWAHFTSVAHVKYQIQDDKNSGTWIWISPNGSHGSSGRATPWTGRSILKAESRKDHNPWSTNSWVVWFSRGILNLQPLPAERSKTFRKMSVNTWHLLLESSFNLINITTNQSIQVHLSVLHWF